MTILHDFRYAHTESVANQFDASENAKQIKSSARTNQTPRAKLQRTQRLQQLAANLVDELKMEGFGLYLAQPGPATVIGPEIEDPKTKGKIGHAQERLGTYIRRVSIRDNFLQRPPFDHIIDPIYRRLIRDLIEGAAMPPTKIAALRNEGGTVTSLQEDGIRYSIIDGLQRLYCFLIAILLVWRREQLVKDRFISAEAWKFFAYSVNRNRSPRSAVEELLQRTIRFEIFYGINLAGLLHYTVTFNSEQRRMSLKMQLELMKKPLIEQLKGEGISIWEDMGKITGEKRPKGRFSASDLVLATQAFVTNDAHVTANSEVESFLDEDQPYLDDVRYISDVIRTLKRITTEIHPMFMQVYEGDTSKRHLISDGETFLVGFVAACGYVRNRGSMVILDRALNKWMKQLNRGVKDPANLESYQQALSVISHMRGKAARRLVDDTFRRFFLGGTTELEWLDTARQITGGGTS